CGVALVAVAVSLVALFLVVLVVLPRRATGHPSSGPSTTRISRPGSDRPPQPTGSGQPIRRSQPAAPVSPRLPPPWRAGPPAPRGGRSASRPPGGHTRGADKLIPLCCVAPCLSGGALQARPGTDVTAGCYRVACPPPPRGCSMSRSRVNVVPAAAGVEAPAPPAAAHSFSERVADRHPA